MLEYAGIRVRDLERARRFYTEGLGLVPVGTDRMAAGGVREILRDPASGARLELNFYPDSPQYREGDELDHLGFRSDDLEGTMARLLALGARLRIPLFDDGGVRRAFLSDPDGIWIELFDPGSVDQPPTSRPME